MMIRALVLALFASLCSLSQAEESVAFVKQAQAVGDRREDTQSMSAVMEIEVKVDGQVLQTVEHRQSETERIRTTVLATDGGEITKVEIECLDKTSAQTGPAGSTESKSPLIGATVVATRNGAEIELAGADGQPLDATLRKAALAEARTMLGDGDGEFQKILPDRPVEIGESFHIDLETARELLGVGKDDSLNEIELVLKLVRRLNWTNEKARTTHDVGLFDVSIRMSGEAAPGINVSAELAGELLIDTATTWPLLMELDGEMAVTGEQSQGGQSIEFIGTGPMKMTRSAIYDRKP